MLLLTIDRKGFDAIVSGERKEEYRNVNVIYCNDLARYEGRKTKIRFRGGYYPERPEAVCKVIITRQIGGNPEWGAEPDREYWTIKILKVKKVKIYEID